MLTTLLFILWAYGMYALISALAGRKGSKFRGRGSGRRYGWLALGLGLLVGLGLTVVLARSFVEPDHNLRLAGFLGTVWAEGWLDKVNQRVEYPPIKGTATGNQPVYALLHPGTSPTELAQERSAAKPRPIKKPKVRNLPVPQGKSPKSAIQVDKKDKGAAKVKSKTTAKKKKPWSPAPTAGPNGLGTAG